MMALGRRVEDAASEIGRAAALKLFESGRISSGLAAQLSGMSRVEFLYSCGQNGISIFQQNPDEITSDSKAVLHARNR